MKRVYKIVAIVCVTGSVITGVMMTRHHWLPLVIRQNSATTENTAPQTGQFALPNEQVTLSKQAQRNLRLTSKPLQATTYWKTIQVPGIVVDRPGISDRGVVAPVTAVVTAIYHYAGDTVKSGEALFKLRLVGESFQTSQKELFKAMNEQKITQEHLDRLQKLAKSGAIPKIRLIELDNELRRLAVNVQAYRQDLQIRGLTSAQIDSISKGTFISEIIISVPPQLPTTKSDTSDDPSSQQRNNLSSVFEIQELKVELGQQVQAGQTLCMLSSHHRLFIEGRAFQQELPLFQRAAEEAWPIRVELVEQAEYEWPMPIPSVVVHHISNTLNEKNRTVSFYLPLTNQFRTYKRDGRSQFLWRFRPGQRVRLRADVEKIDNVFVLPTEAVVREGPEFYVFRQNGDLFDRKPVHVVHQTQSEVVIANDGSIPPGIYVAQTGAVQLNRVLKSQSGSAPAGVHVHADGSVHSNH